MNEYVVFTGAYMSVDDDGNKTYTPRGEIMVKRYAIDAYYSHTLLVADKSIRVMETYEEIKKKLM